MCQDSLLLIADRHLDPEHAIRQRFRNHTFDFNTRRFPAVPTVFRARA